MQAQSFTHRPQVVELVDASVRLADRWVLARLDVSLAPGAALWITGSNGAGKSTLLWLMAGMRAPERGSLRLFGQVGPPWRPTTRRRLGLMGHAHGLYEALSGPENLRWWAELAGLRGAAADAAAAARLAEVDLTAARDLPVGRYSAGMQRRLTLARLLLWGPELMLVDEPFVQLDAAGEEVVQRALSGHLADGGTLVFTSHDASAARRLAAARLHLEGGFATSREVGGDSPSARRPEAGAMDLRAPAAGPRPPGLCWLRQAWWMLRKDLALEARLRLVTATLPSFAALMLLLFSFTAGAHGQVLAVMTPGAVWLTVLLCSTLSMNESMRQEAEHGVLPGLLLAGLAPSAIYVGKAAGNVLALLVLTSCMAPLAYALFGLTLPEAPLAATLARLAATSLSGVLAVAAPGTLLAAMSQGPRRALVVPLLYYPLVVPALLAAVRASACALAGDPMHEWSAWLALAVAYNFVYWPLCTFLFAHVIEDV